MSTSTTSSAPTSLRLALIQLGGVGPDKAANLAAAREKIKEAGKGGKEGRKPDLVVLPEIFNSPYATDQFRRYAEAINFPSSRAEQAQYKASECGCESIEMLSKAAKEEGVWLVGGSIPELALSSGSSPEGQIFNSSPTFTRSGQLVALHRKVHLFDIDIPGGIRFQESETLTGGDKLTVVETEFGKIAIGICYDLRFPEMAQIAAREGCIAMIYPAAFNTTTGPLHWDLLMRSRAVDNQFYVALCSPARATEGDGYKAWGFSGVADPMGKIVAQLDEKAGILFVDLDLEAIKKARAGIPVTKQRRFDVYTGTERMEKSSE